MAIIYLTTAMMPADFNDVIYHSLIKPNPSNQNFHYKLIKALKCYHHVDVISIRPVTPKTSKKRKYAELTRDGYFHYLPLTNIPLIRPIQLVNAGVKKAAAIIKESKEPVIVIFDGLNNILIEIAKRIKKKYNMRAISIITDKAENLSNVSARYVSNINKGYLVADGFITLSSSLNHLINPHNLPVFLFHGIVDEPVYPNKEIIDEYGKYFFFAGTLMERYGVKNMIEAFLMLPGDCKLLIAGRGPLHQYVEQKAAETKRIIYLGLISEQEVDAFNASAIGVINPRPLNDELDLYSFPSKVLSYFNSGATVFSTDHPVIATLFKYAYVSLGDGNTSKIYDVFNDYFIHPDKYQSIGEAGRKVVAKVANTFVIGEQLREFLR